MSEPEFMVMLGLGPGIIDKVGKEGPHRYRRDRYGLHKEKTPTKKKNDPRSNTPNARKFRQCTNAWLSHEWTQEELYVWWSYCRNNPIVNKIGEPRCLYPAIAFLQINLKRLTLGLDIIYIPQGY